MSQPGMSEAPLQMTEKWEVPLTSSGGESDDSDEEEKQE